MLHTTCFQLGGVSVVWCPCFPCQAEEKKPEPAVAEAAVETPLTPAEKKKLAKNSVLLGPLP